MGACCTMSQWPPDGQTILGEYPVQLVSKRYESKPITAVFAITSQRVAIMDSSTNEMLITFRLIDVDDILLLQMMNRLIITIVPNERIIIESQKIAEIEEQIRFIKYMNTNPQCESPFNKKMVSALDITEQNTPIAA